MFQTRGENLQLQHGHLLGVLELLREELDYCFAVDEPQVRQIQRGQRFFPLVFEFPDGPENHTESD